MPLTLRFGGVLSFFAGQDDGLMFARASRKLRLDRESKSMEENQSIRILIVEDEEAIAGFVRPGPSRRLDSWWSWQEMA